MQDLLADADFSSSEARNDLSKKHNRITSSKKKNIYADAFVSLFFFFFVKMNRLLMEYKSRFDRRAFCLCTMSALDWPRFMSVF